jgi:NADH dehydrogenase
MGGVWVEGLIARFMYLSLYKMHEIALHGVPTVLLDTLASSIASHRAAREAALSLSRP